MTTKTTTTMGTRLIIKGATFTGTVPTAPSNPGNDNTGGGGSGNTPSQPANLLEGAHWTYGYYDSKNPLAWKTGTFYTSDFVEVEGGRMIRVSWDIPTWLQMYMFEDRNSMYLAAADTGLGPQALTPIPDSVRYIRFVVPIADYEAADNGAGLTAQYID